MTMNFEEFCPYPVVGKGNIMAGVLADSVNVWGNRLTTFRLHYPRFIHAEFMTHRMFSKNASSSRAIPVSRVIEQVTDNPAMPIHWGKNQPGMQANEECTNPIIQDVDSAGYKTIDFSREDWWRLSAKEMIKFAREFSDSGYHKQVVNRLLEPYQYMNVVMSATDLDNFFWLRIHEAADPNIHELARVMYEAYSDSTPEELRFGEWHTPYVIHTRDVNTNELKYFLDSANGDSLSAEDACKISASCAAQASYRKLDTSIDKALSIYDKLVEMTPIHASPFEHVATPFSEKEIMVRSQAKHTLDINNIDNSDQVFYKGNFKGWTQLRKTFKNENYTKQWKPDND